MLLEKCIPIEGLMIFHLRAKHPPFPRLAKRLGNDVSDHCVYHSGSGPQALLGAIGLPHPSVSLGGIWGSSNSEAD